MLLNESMRRLKHYTQKLGGCIERARPYYEALEFAKQYQIECQRAAVQFQRANGLFKKYDNKIFSIGGIASIAS
jgi:hypothetical protein